MPINGRALLDAAVLLSEQEQWRLTVAYSTGTGVANALCGFGGSLLLGPPGIMIGVGISAAVSYLLTKNKYKPFFVILKEDLRPHQQEELIHLLKEAFKDLSPQDAITIAQLMMDKRELGIKLKEIVTMYLMKSFVQQVHDQSENTQYISNEKMVLETDYMQQALRS